MTHELDEAEVLCGRVVAMRDGRVLDSGPPAELVDRHARWATVRFTLHPAASAALLAELDHVVGVQEVQRAGERIVMHGDRRMIAHVGAALVRWGPVPEDLSVEIPDLEDALLDLLDGADSTSKDHTVGALR